MTLDPALPVICVFPKLISLGDSAVDGNEADWGSSNAHDGDFVSDCSHRTYCADRVADSKLTDDDHSGGLEFVGRYSL
jgi:hypothetical protein